MPASAKILVALSKGLFLHNSIVGPSGSLGDGPSDVFVRHLDAAALAVDAVLGIDLQVLGTAFLILDILIDPRRTEALLGSIEFFKGDIAVYNRLALILDSKVGGLVVFVGGSRPGEVSQKVKAAMRAMRAIRAIRARSKATSGRLLVIWVGSTCEGEGRSYELKGTSETSTEKTSS